MSRLAIVVAARDSAASLRHCLTAIQPAIGAIDAELIVVAPEGSRDAAIARDLAVTFTVPGDPLVPDLWRTGILNSRSEWVATTIGQCVPDERWVGALLTAIDDSVAAVGGPILLGSTSPVVSAAFLLRYSGYLPPFDRHDAADVPGDNAVYRRAAIDAVADSWHDGFWENRVNAALRRRGDWLVMDPRPVTRLVSVGSQRAFLRQRFDHGRIYGDGRRSLVRALGAPAVPIVMIGRIAGRVRSRPAYGPVLRTSILPLVGDIAAWTAGETVGLVAGR